MLKTKGEHSIFDECVKILSIFDDFKADQCVGYNQKLIWVLKIDWRGLVFKKKTTHPQNQTKKNCQSLDVETFWDSVCGAYQLGSPQIKWIGRSYLPPINWHLFIPLLVANDMMIAILSTPSSCDFTQTRIFPWFLYYSNCGNTKYESESEITIHPNRIPACHMVPQVYMPWRNWASRISKKHFRRAGFLLQRFQFCKDVFVFRRKKRHSLTKKKKNYMCSCLSLLACLLLEKKKHPKTKKKRERNIRHHMGLLQIWGYSTPPSRSKGVSLGGWHVQCLGGSM